MRVHELLEEALPLVGEDLRAARRELGISPTVAAERAKLDPALYRALETADVVREHSRGLVDVIGKKLRKKYEEGTVLVVLAEQAERVHLGELHDFVRTNNHHNLRVVIIDRSETAGRFKVLPLEEVIEPTSSEAALLEIDVEGERASMGHRGYQGVVLRPLLSRFLPEHPVFVKNLELHR